MAEPSICKHTFTIIKSSTTLLLWRCGQCQSGPHWYIYQCTLCSAKACKRCSEKRA
ncbi:hypothetical protein BAUCODRAFT_80753 [Baudoinia panamericana UAMH 10762]|uniref:Uncharacterized protein n=1 Tax=Baudoinia panamericana (strain UAMH 10762) TaxID=717646 RepID=M2M2V0_BAUPA|nr:uncharacterized protein BAUCODRAFT_80753 [Baudoinia panamericana UAMH 10762]EMC90856.1 hypothetical protein BAUCODRAFT_80753 [Baudoinia panamericana UAMH 10762]